MLSRNIVKVSAKSAAARLVDAETAEVRFLTDGNKSLRASSRGSVHFGASDSRPGQSRALEHVPVLLIQNGIPRSARI